MRKKLLAMALSVAMVFTMLPMGGITAFAADVPLTGSPTYTVNSSVIGFAGQEWYVIGYNGTGVASAASEVTLLVKGDNPYGKSTFHGSNNEYSGSNLKTAMQNLYDDTNKFSTKEKALIVPRNLTVASDGISGSDANTQYLWPLSTAEANQINDTIRSTGSYWWLRSPGNSSNRAAGVYSDGTVSSSGDYVDYNFGVRPALKLNLSSVLFASAATGGKSGTAGATLSATQSPTVAQKLTVVDSGITAGTVTATGAATTSGDIYVSAAGATANKSLSAIITDTTGKTVKYYGKIADIGADSSVTNAKLTLPVTLDIDNVLKVFAEEINGDNLTDYASTPVDVTVTVENTKPTVASVTPTSTGAAVDGSLAITFDEAMNTTAGTVTLTAGGNTTTPTAPTWSNGNKTVTYAYTGLANNTAYTVNISGFKDVAGNEMIADSAKKFTTSAPTTYLLTINNTGGGVSTANGSYAKDTVINLVAGTRSGYTFNGWTAAGVTLANGSSATTTFTMPANAVTVTANWTRNSSGGGGSSYEYYTITATAGTGGNISTGKYVSVREGDSAGFTFTPDKGYQIADVLINGKSVGAVKTYTFTNVRSNQTIHVTFKASNPHVNPQTGVAFEDVQGNDWFVDSVYTAVGNGWFSGTSKTTFSPYGNTTRGMIATVLWRMEKEPTANAASIFEDVASGAYYADGVNWAQENGIVGGYGNGKFGPQDNITREQMAAILYRYAQFKGYDVSKTVSLDSFTDGGTTSNYAKAPMSWAVENSLISGKGNGILDPHGNATRAEVATILTRFDELFSEK